MTSIAAAALSSSSDSTERPRRMMITMMMIGRRRRRRRRTAGKHHRARHRHQTHQNHRPQSLRASLPFRRHSKRLFIHVFFFFLLTQCTKIEDAQHRRALILARVLFFWRWERRCASGARVVSRRASACEECYLWTDLEHGRFRVSEEFKKKRSFNFCATRKKKKKKRSVTFLFIREEHFIRDARETQPKNKAKNKRVIHSDDAGDELRRLGRSFG